LSPLQHIHTESKDYTKPLKELKTTVMEAVTEYIDEMEASIHNISAQVMHPIFSYVFFMPSNC